MLSFNGVNLARLFSLFNPFSSINSLKMADLFFQIAVEVVILIDVQKGRLVIRIINPCVRNKFGRLHNFFGP